MSRKPPVATPNLIVPGLEEYSVDIWRSHAYPGDSFTVDDEPVLGEHYKLRANFPEEVFRKHKAKILRWIFQHGMRAEFEAQGHAVVKSVKHVLDACFDDTADRRYRDSGQLTIFLQPTATPQAVGEFARKFQNFINSLIGEVTPHAPMENDFRLKDCPNLSMRLNDIDGAYQSSILISTSRPVSAACGFMVRDSNMFALLAEGASGVLRENEYDKTHYLYRLGYEVTVRAEKFEASAASKEQHVAFGQACQSLALVCRLLQNCTLTNDCSNFYYDSLVFQLDWVVKNEMDYAAELEEVYTELPYFELLVSLRMLHVGESTFDLSMSPPYFKTLAENSMKMIEEQAWHPSAVLLYMERVNRMIDEIPNPKASAYLALESYRIELLAKQKAMRHSAVAAPYRGDISQALAAIDLLQVCIQTQSTALVPLGDIRDAGLRDIVQRHDLSNKEARVYLPEPEGPAASAGVPVSAP